MSALVPVQDLNLVLSKLMGSSLEHMETASLSFSSRKSVFLVAITSARSVSELQAFLTDLPFTVFNEDKVSLRPHPKCMHKVVSTFHLNQIINLPGFVETPFA